MPAAQNVTPTPQGAAPEQTGPRFTGHPVSLDFQGADLRAVLRTFAEISGLNVVIDPTITGSVDVSLRDVPWDQALDIILKANKLGYYVDGSIVRIAPLGVLADEEAQRRKLADEQALAGELRVFTRPLSYAKAADLIPILTRSALSARGEVQVDPRTNTVIIRDLPDRLTAAAELIGTLDLPQPQVEIEARIVQTSRDFARSLGVQWGINGRVSPELGNTTPLAFPNSGSLTGRTGGVQGPDLTPTGVNLGVANATSALGLALGSINGALNLDVALTALEASGQGRLLSTPRVSTQNNVEAEITQGVQIPIQTVANNTVTVTFKDAALTLKVTPQITASNTVIMRVFLENAAPDYSRAVVGIPPIDTQRAVTTVLVGDGDTTVIGGIYLSREQSVAGPHPVHAQHSAARVAVQARRDQRREPRAADFHHAAHHQGLAGADTPTDMRTNMGVAQLIRKATALGVAGRARWQRRDAGKWPAPAGRRDFSSWNGSRAPAEPTPTSSARWSPPTCGRWCARPSTARRFWSRPSSWIRAGCSCRSR